jgi:hypothetical protein
MLAFLVVFFLAVLVPSVVLSLVFEVEVVPALAVMGVVVALVTVALAWVDSRAHRGRCPKRVPGMASITGLASRSVTAWGPTRFLHDELLPWVKNHNIGLHAPAVSPVPARLYSGLGFVPALEHGPLALTNSPVGMTSAPTSHSAGTGQAEWRESCAR